MSTSTQDRLVSDAARNGATIYAGLMNFALDEPRRELYSFIEKRVEALTGNLAEELAEQLRRAYVAGVADGYRQAQIEKDS